jgi:hypothetical protein
MPYRRWDDNGRARTQAGLGMIEPRRRVQRVVSQFELLIATFPAPHNLSGDVMSMIRRF